MKRPLSSRISPYSILYVIAILLMTTAFSFAMLSNEKNLLLIVAMALSPLLLLMRRCRILMPRIDIPMLSFLLLMILSATLWHPESFRASTIIYSAGFCIFFLFTARLMRASHLSPRQFILLLQCIVYAYGVMLLLQQFCVLVGLPVPNYISPYANPWKLCSLAREPSYMDTTLGIIMFMYGMIMRQQHPDRGLWYNLRHYPFLWLAYLWCLFTPVNASGFAALPLSLIPWITRRNMPWVAGAVVALAILFAVAAPHIRSGQAGRAARMVTALTTMDEDKIIDTDISIAERIVPAMRTARLLDIREADFWLGHGTDAEIRDTAPSPCEYPTPAYIFHVWYNYGFITELALLWLIFSICFVPRQPLTWVVTIGAIVYAAYNNSTNIWLILTLMLQYRLFAAPHTPLLYHERNRMLSYSQR